MTLQEIHEKLKAEFGDAVGDVQPATDPFVVVDRERLLEIVRFLKDTPELDMALLQDETAVDYPDESLIRMVYHLWSYGRRHGIVLKVECDRAAPVVDTLEGLWPVANWFEREIHDLLGVDFTGHSDLRPIMLPDDWEGHPLRKDYVEPDGYHGISHVRFSTIDGYSRMDELKRKAAEAAAAEAAEAEPAGEGA